MIGPFRTLLQSHYVGDARDFVAAHFPSAIAAGNTIAVRFAINHSITELVAEPTACWIRTRLFADRPPTDADLPLDVLDQLIETVQLSDAGLPIGRDTIAVTAHPPFDTLIAAITDPARRLPIVVMSEPLDRELVGTARDLAGFAHVARVANRLCHRFVEQLGPQWPLYGGAIRTFAIPFSNNKDQHPIVLARNRPAPETFIARVRGLAVHCARNFPFPAVAALSDITTPAGV